MEDTTPELERSLLEQQIGRCMLRLQEYELLLKELLIHGELEGSTQQLQERLEVRRAKYTPMTLGMLANEFTTGYVRSDAEPEQPDSVEANPKELRHSFRAGIETDADRHTELTSAIKTLVRLRNDLVHHFLSRFELSRASGLRTALDHVQHCNRIVDDRYAELKGWADAALEARQSFAAMMQSPEILEFIANGIMPDGTVSWPDAGIARVLHRASETLGREVGRA